MSRPVLERLSKKFTGAILEQHSNFGDDTIVVPRERLVEIAEFLRDDPEMAFNVPIDNTCVDYLGKHAQRFEVIWHLYSLEKGHRLRVKVRVAEEDPVVPSLTPVWRGMNWHEREAYDLYGIRFSGHPNLKRILMYDEFEGHPLRKDYPIDKRQPLIEMRQVKQVGTQKHPTPEMLNRP